MLLEVTSLALRHGKTYQITQSDDDGLLAAVNSLYIRHSFSGGSGTQRERAIIVHIGRGLRSVVSKGLELFSFRAM